MVRQGNASEPGEGSVFTVTVSTGPLDGIRLLDPHEVLAADQDADSQSQARWEFPPALVLVVDDGEENRELVTVVLEEAGLLVDNAADGKAAMEKALSQSFDLILMDVQMPVMDGYTATRRLREQGLHIPIIAMTGHAMKGFGRDCLAAGFSSYMTKPIDIDGLLETLAELLGGYRVQNMEAEKIALQPSAVEAYTPGGVLLAAEPQSSPAAPADSGPPIVSRLTDANPRFQKIIESFIPRLHEQLQAMQLAWKAGDFAELADLAHWLKGAGGTVGFDEFTEPALRLETLAKAKSEEGIEETIQELLGLVQRVVLASAESAQGTTTPVLDQT